MSAPHRRILRSGALGHAVELRAQYQPVDWEWPQAPHGVP